MQEKADKKGSVTTKISGREKRRAEINPYREIEIRP